MMLQIIREYTGGWAAWIIITLVSIPFALWGIQEYTKIGSQRLAATVNGYEINENELIYQVQQTRMRMRSSLGSAYNPELFDQVKLRKDALEGMIRQQLVLDTSIDMGLRVGDGQVRSAILTVPSFNKDGQFDNAMYESVLARQGRTPRQFEEEVRASLTTAQLDRVVSASEFITEQDLAEVIKLRNQKRSFKYFTLPAKDFITNTAIPDKEIENYYNSHSKDFQIPEQIKLDYLVLELSHSNLTEQITDVQLQELYQTHIQQYTTPERRQIRHILITLAPAAKPEIEEVARKKIADIRTRILAGATFESVAKESSQDPGSASQGGDLGLVKRGVMVKEFENAAFALPQGKLSEPIRSNFGFHLIEVTKIEPEITKPFIEVRNELLETARTEALTRDYLRLAEKLGNLTYEHSDSLEPAAQALNLKIQHSPWLSKSGGSGLFSNSKVMKAAFSDEVLVQSNNSELIEITENKQQQAIVMRVVEHQDTTIKPLAKVKEQITKVLHEQQAQQAAFKQAGQLVISLRQGHDLNKVAGNYKIEEQTLILRDISAINLPIEILKQAFQLPNPKPPMISADAVKLTNGNAAVIVLGEIQDGKLVDLDETQRKDESRKLAQVRAKHYYDTVLDDIKNRADIWIAPQDSRQIGVE